jgi:hypothetical protein
MTLGRDRKASRDASAVRRAYTGALAERLGLEAESFSRPGALARSLRRRGVSTNVALEAELFLRQLDEAAFSSSGGLPADAADRAAKLYRSVNTEALARAHFGLPALCVVGLLAIGVATAHAIDATMARQAFDRGVAAYDHHDFVTAREAFIAAAMAEPRAPDAWADLGTASWAVGDTARSVAAWQRALRLEPLASDVRDRVDLAHALTWTSAGYVPPVSPAWLFDLSAVIWCFAWGAAAYPANARMRVSRRRLTTLCTVAVLIAIAGFALADRVSGRRLGVMRATESLRSDPELDSERGATAIVGEVVRVTGRQGAWTRVVLDDGRDGWLESSALVSLDAIDAAQIGGD